MKKSTRIENVIVEVGESKHWNQNLSKIHQKCPNFRHILTKHVSENQTLRSIVRQCLKSKLCGNQTVIEQVQINCN